MKKKKGLALFLILCLLLGLSSCRTGAGEEETESLSEGEYRVYYVNNENTKLISTVYQAAAQGSNELVAELMNVLHQNPDNTEWKTARPDGVELRSYSLDNEILTLNFNSAYQNVEPVKEILYRAAVVKTLVQIPEVSGVQFMINDQPLMDASKNAVGVMQAETFLEESGDQVSKEQTATLILYFTNEDGTELVSTEQRVRYTTGYSLERAVVTQLLKGPSTDGLYPTLPSSATLLGISVRDGVCYVDFDQAFLDDALNVAEYIPIYSLVNSLSELGTVSRVQITINGSSDYTFRGVFPLNQTYERNLDYKGE